MPPFATHREADRRLFRAIPVGRIPLFWGVVANRETAIIGMVIGCVCCVQSDPGDDQYLDE